MDFLSNLSGQVKAEDNNSRLQKDAANAPVEGVGAAQKGPIPKPGAKKSAENQDETVLMAMNIYAEARGESDDGKSAVGQVVYNRVHGRMSNGKGVTWWGSSIKEVITKSKQFSWLNNRSSKEYKNALNPTETALWEKSYQIAQMTLNGGGTAKISKSNGVVADSYCANTPDWATADKYITKISHHKFYTQHNLHLNGSNVVVSNKPSSGSSSSGGSFDVSAAVDYNKKRGYSKDLWKQIQTKVGTTPDGAPGKLTATAIYNWQVTNGLGADGCCGPKTLAAMNLSNSSSSGGNSGGTTMGNGDVDSSEIPAQSSVRTGKSIYGKPCTANCQARLTLPYTMYADYGSDGLGKKGAEVKTIPCHKLIHNRVYNIFKETLETFGAENIHQYRLDVFSGAYVPKNTGSSGSNANASSNWAKMSMHSWGVALDVDGGNNPNRVDKNNVDWLNVNSAKGKEHNISKFWDIVAKYGGYSLGKQSNKDWMHFQFASFK